MLKSSVALCAIRSGHECALHWDGVLVECWRAVMQRCVDMHAWPGSCLDVWRSKVRCVEMSSPCASRLVNSARHSHPMSPHHCVECLPTALPTPTLPFWTSQLRSSPTRRSALARTPSISSPPSLQRLPPPIGTHDVLLRMGSRRSVRISAMQPSRRKHG